MRDTYSPDDLWKGDRPKFRVFTGKAFSSGHDFEESEIVVEAPVTGAACGDQV